MGPYTKIAGKETWSIQDGDAHVIATVETESLADAVLHFLLGKAEKPPAYPANKPLDGDDFTDGSQPYRCNNCDYRGEEAEFWPSDGDPAPVVCPECGRTDCFPV